MKSGWCFFGRNELFGLTPWLLEGLKAVGSNYTKKKHHQKASAKPILADCFKRRGEEHAPEKLRRLRFLLGWKKKDSQILERSRDKTYKTQKKITFFFFWRGVFVFKSIIIQWAMAVQKHHSRNSHLGCRTIPNLHPEGDRGEGLAFFFSVKKTSKYLGFQGSDLIKSWLKKFHDVPEFPRLQWLSVNPTLDIVRIFIPCSWNNCFFFFFAMDGHGWKNWKYW